MSNNDWIKLLSNLNVNKDIVFEFFSLFSRFEFALKDVGYFRKKRNKNAEPNWNKFAEDINNESHSDFDLHKFNQAILKFAPKCQIVDDSGVNPKVIFKNRDLNGANDVDSTLIGIRRIRNNLFHGGKMGNRQKYDNSRDEDLLKFSLKVMYLIVDKCNYSTNQMLKDFHYHFYDLD